MIKQKELASQLTFYAGMESIIETYTLISAARIQRIRSAVLKNREFVDELNQIYQALRASYKSKLHLLSTAKAQQEPVVLHNGKRALVFVSANARLYGEIIPKIYDRFIEEVSKAGPETEVVILGKVGKALYERSGYNLPMQYFDMLDDDFDQDLLKKLAENLINFNEVTIFYGQFESISTQVAAASPIPGELVVSTNFAEQIHYLFEPTLEKILLFFETEIFASVFAQKLFEARLAKYASRMNYLNQASEEIKKNLKKLNFQKLYIKHRKMAIAQAESVVGITMWQP